MTSLRDIVTEGDRFLVGAELVSARGPIKPGEGGKIMEFVDGLASADYVDWISVTDNAGGNPMQAPYILGKAIMERGKQAVIHITCKDNNRNGLEALAWMYTAEGLDNLLVLSGDYPIDGQNGIAQPVFDIDSVGLLKMLSDMNKGLTVKGRKPGTTMVLEKTNFFLGCTVSPFKLTEAEQMMQYQKFRAKAKAGADFIIPQVGYDIRKSQELMEYMKEHDINLPLIGNIYKLGYGVAKIFNRGFIPGCVVSDELLARIEKERKADDRGKKYFTHLAAMQFAAFKKMGYRGGYIGGVEKYKDFAAIVDAAAGYEDVPLTDLVKDLVYPRTAEFYYFARDNKTGLADVSKKNPILEERVKSRYKKNVNFGYRFSRMIHALAFSEKSPFQRLGRPIFNFLEKHEKLDRAAYFNERMAKATIFECKECGDCSLADIAYLCPQSQCQKNQRNGPCGGSRDGLCELSACGKECIWVRAYDRERYFSKDLPNLLDREPVIKDASLKGTSGWANYFLNRDHFAKKNGDNGSRH
ncbi:MAG: methylenetetrahydrofolate reductase [Spirochaetales bacterium]|nr:methylenetetrahydrofolate reductase [Spirochaetales bacterium]